MIKLFFIIFFIAELIIALAVIIKICKIDIRVNRLNDAVSVNKHKIKYVLSDFRLALETFVDTFEKLKRLVRQKQSEYFLKAMETTLIYGSLFFLKGKYKKTILTYQLAREIFEGIQEGEFI